MIEKLLVAGVGLISAMMPLKAFAANFSQFYVFGDSLSDTGNVFQVTGGFINPNTAIPPSPPYKAGRFSNDKIWVDYVGDSLGLNPTLFTSLNTTIPTQGVNFAFGGANSGTGNAVSDAPLPGVLEQVQLFAQGLLVNQQKADPNALYAIWGGANDYVFSQQKDPSKPIANISAAISTLAQAGAKNIMVFNLPDLGKLPLALASGNSLELTGLTNQHNSGLANVLSNVAGVNIISVDTYSIFNRVLRSPDEFTLKDVMTPCVIGNFADIKSVCSNPNELLFFDSIHPSTVGHSLIAQTALSAIKASTMDDPKHSSIPEPSVILGLLMLGGVSLKTLKNTTCRVSSSTSK